MRFKLTLNLPDGHYRVLPINYQYELSAWIYKVLNLGDASFSAWLHNRGYLTQGRHYKLFTFSRLQMSQFKVHQDRLHILSQSITLNLSFYTPISAETFITGLFRQQQFSLGDSQSKVPFEVASISAEPIPEFKKKARFRLLSPLCVSTMHLRNDKLMPLYLSPTKPIFTKLFTENLLNKYTAWTLTEPSMQQAIDPAEVRLQLLTEPVSKLVTIKAGTPQQTKVRGYLFDFEIAAPTPLLKAGYYAGFGEKNSLGFGCAEVLK